MTTAYSQLLKPGDLAFDIGAYVGSRTDMFLALGCSKVIAVEPVVEYWLRLKEKYKDDSRVHPLWMAAGERLGIEPIYIHRKQWPNGTPMDSAMSSMSADWIQSAVLHPEWGLDVADWGHQEKIVVVTLDSMIQSYGLPDFIKIDVEGWEREVIRGLSQPVKALSFEFHSQLHMDWTEQAIEHLLQLATYKFNYDLEDKLQLVSPDWLDEDELLYRIMQLESYGDIFAKLV